MRLCGQWDGRPGATACWRSPRGAEEGEALMAKFMAVLMRREVIGVKLATVRGRRWPTEFVGAPMRAGRREFGGKNGVGGGQVRPRRLL
jgi:hypothetical protein